MVFLILAVTLNFSISLALIRQQQRIHLFVVDGNVEILAFFDLQNTFRHVQCRNTWTKLI